MYPNNPNFLSSDPYAVWWKYIDQSGNEHLCETSGHSFIHMLQSYLRGRFENLSPSFREALRVPPSNRVADISDFPLTNRWDAETIRSVWLISPVYEMDMGYPYDRTNPWGDAMDVDSVNGTISPEQIRLAAAMISGQPYENVRINTGPMNSVLPSPSDTFPQPSRPDYRCRITRSGLEVPWRPAPDSRDGIRLDPGSPGIRSRSTIPVTQAVFSQDAAQPTPATRSTPIAPSWGSVSIIAAIGATIGFLIGKS